MLTTKQTTLKPLIESKDGVHLTAYLVNRGDAADLKAQLRATIYEAYEWLNTAMSFNERNKFLEPLDSLLHDSRIFEQMKGNIGIFRNEDSFRILSIPIDVEQCCQVATSFHIKPLLRWIQTDQDFLFLGIGKEAAHLYVGSQDSFRMLDSIAFSELFKNQKKRAEISFWVNEWISELTKNSKPKLFVAGKKSDIQPLKLSLIYKNSIATPISNSFSEYAAINICQDIRKILKEESEKYLENALLEFRFAEEDNRARKNIFQISKAVVQGKVRKLIVTDELNIFGKIDHKSGGLAIHPYDLDHEDDCILDDLAQMVLRQGGEVVIAKRNEIPKNRPILAIIDDGGKSLEKTENSLKEYFQERLR